MERIPQTPMLIEYDADTGVWDVYQHMGGQRREPKGFVSQEADGTWSSSRHTHTGVPASHGAGFSDKETAAISLIHARPYHGPQHNHPTLDPRYMHGYK